MTSRKKAAKKARRAAKETKKAREKAIEDWRQEYGGGDMDAQLDKLVDLDQMEAQNEQRVNDAKVKMRAAHRDRLEMEAQVQRLYKDFLTVKEKKMSFADCSHGFSERLDLYHNFLLVSRYALLEASYNRESSLHSLINAGIEATRVSMPLCGMMLPRWRSLFSSVYRLERIIS
jgi:hypothetical protein